jgi:hypothetical protein
LVKSVANDGSDRHSRPGKPVPLPALTEEERAAIEARNGLRPFVDGNGRTSRIMSYPVLCAKLGYRLPGTKTIPERIAESKKPYYAALESADMACNQGRVDVSAMEALLQGHLEAQLMAIRIQATSGHRDNVE